MAKADDPVDDLYRQPLAAFTAARNALAKGHPDGAAIKKLEKPSVPAWAVNQLFWNARDVYDEVVRASEALRAAHRKMLSGKPADIREAEKSHREAIRAAVDRAREILAAGGQAATPQTMTAVAETLEALPSATDAPGRLVRPLKPAGFEALSDVAFGPSSPGKRPSNLQLVVGRKDRGEGRRDAVEARREAERARREAEEEKARLKEAQREAQQASAAEAKARAAVERAQREVERREADLAAARATLDQARKDLKDAVAVHERARLRSRQ